MSRSKRSRSGLTPVFEPWLSLRPVSRGRRPPTTRPFTSRRQTRTPTSDVRSGPGPHWVKWLNTQVMGHRPAPCLLLLGGGVEVTFERNFGV